MKYIYKFTKQSADSDFHNKLYIECPNDLCRFICVTLSVDWQLDKKGHWCTYYKVSITGRVDEPTTQKRVKKFYSISHELHLKIIEFLKSGQKENWILAQEIIKANGTC